MYRKFIKKKYNFDHVDFCKIDIEGSEMLSITEETLKPVFDKIDSFFIESAFNYTVT